MNNMLGKKRFVACFVLPALILFISFSMIPLFISGAYSLFQYDGMGEMKFIGLVNYIGLFAEDRHFVKAVLNSFLLVGASLLIQLPISL
ncbi:MAG TPA: sugar ABC transporter permease, partial [Clostridium sp.]|nr:sugar ABC transporter permease [Clostridium sp.]